jgi:hypothetical protein
VSRELEDLIDLDGLSFEEQARLRRVHGLILFAGPPEELPAHLLAPPPRGARGGLVSLGSRGRRPLLALLAAAAVAAACFGAGYLIADQARPSSIRVAQVVTLQGGQQDSFASLRVGSADANGNSPIQLTVTGLHSTSARYVLMLWQDGRPSALCGMFRVGRSGSTTVSFSVPYTITRNTRFVVTELASGVAFPGQVVMTSS